MKRLLLAAALLGLVSCGNNEGEGTETTGGDTPEYAFVTNGVANFWTIASKGVDKAKKDLGVRAEVYMPSEGITQQKQILEDLLTRGVDGVAVTAIDPANQIDILNQVAKNTILITHDSDAPDTNRRVYIGMDNYDAGWLCGELVRQAIPEGGKIAIFIGRLEQDNAKRRRQGTIDNILGREKDNTRYDEPGAVLEGNGYTIVATLTDQFDRAQGKANAEDMLSRHPDLACMGGLFEYNPPLCLEALGQAGKLGDVALVGFDENDATLQGIIDGDVYGTVVQNPYMYGYKSMEVLHALHNGDDSVIPDNRFIDIPARQIVPDNVEAFWADLKEKTGS
ncbi:MAG: sugar-binding protein [Phycisphaerales bacterium]|nr:sugar-binding protein [Phycisphaerales bacterium]